MLGDAGEAQDGAVLLLGAEGLEVGLGEFLEEQAAHHDVVRPAIEDVGRDEVVGGLLAQQGAGEDDLLALAQHFHLDLVTDEGAAAHDVADAERAELRVLVVAA